MPARDRSRRSPGVIRPVAGLVDIHTHLLPALDDGPKDLDGALAMARAAAQAGTSTIAATPHLRADFPDVDVAELADRCQSLQEALQREGIPLRVVSGAEASLVWALEAGAEQLALASYDQRGTDLLVETPSDVTSIEQLLFSLRSRGMRITLAHPERSEAFQRDPRRVERLCEQEVTLQINAAALLARRGSPMRRLAEHLCREGLAQVIASDGHRAESWRPVKALPDGVRAAASLVGAPRAEWMAAGAPAAIVAGVALPGGPDIESGARAWFRARRP